MKIMPFACFDPELRFHPVDRSPLAGYQHRPAVAHPMPASLTRP